MESDDRPEDPKAGRIKRLYDRLADILNGLGPERAEAFQEHLREQASHEHAQEHETKDREPPDRDRPA